MLNKVITYVVIYVSKVSVENSETEAPYQEGCFLIQAFSEEEAQQKVAKYIERYENNVSYKNVYGQTVTWKLQELMSVMGTLDQNLDFDEEFVDIYARSFDDFDSYYRLFEETKKPKDTD
ncbi:DUF4288 domain-containing protein [Mastigocoleus testarum]|uniref:DUF4288 domain-containing protein n=1 Tax=Mastigocoleus testarum BC008 TaxID=371196 RepID=A0A0V7ZX59_9CYAN|nr:DUF4288 domain-containing protein [Mastigocoleus testarum]KST68962.1 hypothetical protein BC008_02480 [Mastigocoleus testarum BC008]